MNKKKAIKILEDQKLKLKTLGFTPVPWIDETSNYISEIFGKDSDQKRQLLELDFKEDYPKTGVYGRISAIDGTPLHDEIDIAGQFIDSLIEHLNKIGLPKKKVITKSEDSTEKRSGIFIRNYLLSFFGTVLVALIGGVFILGYHFGANKFDLEKETLFKEAEHWKLEYYLLKEKLDNSHSNSDTTIVN